MVASKTHPGGPISSERCLFPKKWTNKTGVEVVLGFEAGWWFQICFMFIPTWGNDPILTNIFQMGWNHQLVEVVLGFEALSKFVARILLQAFFLLFHDSFSLREISVQKKNAERKDDTPKHVGFVQVSGGLQVNLVHCWHNMKLGLPL